MREMVPLPGSFMLISILGFVITSVYILSGRLDPYWNSWLFSFDLIFIIMFVASVISITPTFPEEKK